MENSLSYLTVLPSTKEQQKTFANDIIKEIVSGNADPIKLDALFKCIEDTLKLIRKDEKVKDAVQSELAKYPEKTTIFDFGEVTKTSKSTYDFSDCGDIKWNEFNSSMELLKEKIKDREAFLKSIKEPISVNDGDTGEVYDIHPPAKNTSEFHSIKLK